MIAPLAQATTLSSDIVVLHNAGFSLIPLGKGPQGKEPLCGYKGKRRPIQMVTKLMSQKGSRMFGIRLENLVVVDVDDGAPNTMALVERRFGEATVQVDTPRGRHFYYQRGTGPLPDLRKEGLPIDIKTGVNSYVVGPGSVRPDGGMYIPSVGRLDRTNLSTIKLLSPKQRPMPVSSGKVPEGSRNEFLYKKAREYVPCVSNLNELYENLIYDRDNLCEIGQHTVPDAEVKKIAEWAWDKRLTPGGLYQGRNSSFKIQRDVMDALLPRPYGPEAFALYSLLVSNHGHVSGKSFALNHKGLKSSGRITFGRNRFNSARQTLIDLGLLIKSGSYKAGHHSQYYQLGTLRLDPDCFSN